MIALLRGHLIDRIASQSEAVAPITGPRCSIIDTHESGIREIFRLFSTVIEYLFNIGKMGNFRMISLEHHGKTC